MKKYLAVFAALALVCISSMAFAIDTTVSGMISVRSRNFSDLDLNKDVPGGGQVDTQEKIRLEVNVKASDDLRGKISIENYWDTWGRLENYQGSGATAPAEGNLGATSSIDGQSAGQSPFLKIREAWVSFNLPGIPVNVTAGHQLLSLGNAWFLRNLYFGSDAWVVANVTGNNTFALVDIKVSEQDTNLASDDVDAYAVLDVYKINENNTVGIDVANVRSRIQAAALAGANLYNISLNYNGKLGPVALHGQLDVQTGKFEDVPGEPKFKGNEIVIQGNVPLEPVTINFTAAMGSGNKIGDNDVKKFVNFLDIDTHYTYLYEYKIGGPCGIHTGFCNTTALSAGVSADVTKSLNVGVDLWYLQATEKVADVVNPGGTTSDLGTEADVHVNWKLYDNLTWNWQLAYFDPGDGMGKDPATGIQGYLTFKF